MGVTEMKVTMTTSNLVTNGAILSQEELGRGRRELFIEFLSMVEIMH